MSKQVMDKEAINRAGLLKALLGAGAATGAGVGGYALAKHRYSPAAMAAGGPEGAYAGDYLGPRNALEDLKEQMEEAQSEEAMMQALQEAEASGIVFKGASDWMGSFQKSFADEVSKIGVKTAADLKDAKVISDETFTDVEKSAGDVEKIARVLIAHGYAQVALDNLDPQ